MSHDAKIEISTEAQVALKAIIDQFQDEERSVRERQIRIWRMLELKWNGFQRTWWDAVAHDWRVYDADLAQSQYLSDSAFYDRPINVFKAYIEVIIAALSSTVPPVKCSPEDADDPDDIATAKGATQIAELVYKHNDSELLWVKMLWVYALQGMFANYNYADCKEDYGFADVEEIKTENVEGEVKVCPNCGKELAGPELEAAEEKLEVEDDEYDPNSNKSDTLFCVDCAQQVNPELKKTNFVVERFVGMKRQAKTRQKIEVLGGLYVFIPNYAKNQEDAPILGYMRETHYVNIYNQFPHLAKEHLKISSAKVTSSSGNMEYERWGRLSTQYMGDFPMNTPTHGSWWLRPQCYYMIPDEEIRKELEEKAPKGIRVDFVNEIFAQAYYELLDDHWTVARNPLSNYVHYDPLGLLLTAVQDITTDLIDLTLQTIEQGVGQTFADPSVLDFEQYGKTQNLPGSVYPAKPKGGKSLSEAFYQISTASLGREVEPFGAKINELGQFVSGALPSVFGAAGPASQRTAGQQAMSRNSALQRLQTPWKIINDAWKRTFGKVIPAYIKTMIDDEKLVREQHGTFVNEMIKRSQLVGKIGEVTLESSDQLPQTWAQTRDIIMQLLASNNPAVLEALGDPSNLGILKDAIGLPNFTVPGDDDREKQFTEIKLLLKSGPTELPGDQLRGIPPQTVPTIMPELMVDNHYVEAEICRAWLVSPIGMITKTENPEGYANIVAHLEQHIKMMQQLQGPPTDEKTTEKSKPGVNRNGGRDFKPGTPATIS